MSDSEEINLSPSLFEKSEYAVTYAFKALVEADPLVPFAVTWQDDTTTIERYMQGAYDDSIELALRSVNESDANISAYAVVWAGYIEKDGVKMEAVVLEIGEQNSPMSAKIAQPYVQKADGVEKSGEILALGEGPNLLSSKLSTGGLIEHLIKPAYVTTEGFKIDVSSQPFAKMPAAIICLAANLCPGEETERLTAGIHKLQELEGAEDAPALCHRVYTVITSMVASGDFSQVLGTDDVTKMVRILIEGIAQLQHSVSKGLVGKDHAKLYFDSLIELLDAVLTDNGKASAPDGAKKISGLLEGALAA